MRWALRDGKVDYHGVRCLDDGDRFFVLEVDEEGRGPCWRLVVQHGNGQFSEHVDDFDDWFSCSVMALLSIEQGCLENAVWFEATECWACMSSAFGDIARSIDPWKDSWEEGRP